MRTTVTLSLPKKLKIALDRMAKEDGLSRSDFVRQALSDRIFEKRFDRLRRRLIPYARAKGVFTDEDVFERIS